jgi:hypothetical protein
LAELLPKEAKRGGAGTVARTVIFGVVRCGLALGYFWGQKRLQIFLAVQAFLGSSRLQVAKIAREQFFHVELLYVAQHTQNTTTITLAHGNTMNHGGRRRTMAAIVPHPRLRGMKHVANMLCNNTTYLKLDNLIITNTY